MKRTLAYACFVALTIVGANPPLLAGEWPSSHRNDNTTGILAELDRATIALFNRVSPSVVQIIAFGKGKESPGTDITTGSGFFWDSSGNIVTNAHVVRDATTITVWLDSGEQIEADVVGVAPNFDLAVVKAKGLKHPPRPIVVGTSGDLRVGQWAFAIGSPFGLDQSLTSGVISALKRRLPIGNDRSISNVIQTDAAVHPGSSGGPLLDSAGRLIGVNTIAYSTAELGTSLGFAVPVDTVGRIIPLLIRDHRIATPSIGIVAAEEKSAFKSGIEGVIIARIEPKSPAERAALRPMDASGAIGDVVVGANGRPVRNVFELTDELENLGVGRTIALKIKRGGEIIDVQLDIIDIEQQS